MGRDLAVSLMRPVGLGLLSRQMDNRDWEKVRDLICSLRPPPAEGSPSLDQGKEL